MWRLYTDNANGNVIISKDFLIDGAEIEELQGVGITNALNAQAFCDGLRIQMNINLKHRKLFVSKSGYMGLGNSEIQEGDEIFVLAGTPAPCILRPTGKFECIDAGGQLHPTYTLIGGCYVDGIMDGEAVKGKDIKDAQVVCIV